MPRPATIAKIALVVAWISPISAAARSWTVGYNGVEDFERLYDACETASSGDSILVSPGDYDEWDNLIWLEEKPLAIVGNGMNPDDTRFRLRLHQESCRGSLIENLSIRDSWRPLTAAEGELTIRNCTIRNNSGSGTTACISLSASYAIVEDCIFTNNGHSQDQLRNGALSVGDTTIVRRCFFLNNAAIEQAGAMTVAAKCSVEECIFIGNTAATGAAITLFGGFSIVERCTFWGNHPAPPDGGTIYVDDFQPTIGQNIVAGTIDGWGIACPGAIGLACCDLWGNEEGDYWGWVDAGEWAGNFTEDPMFCDPDRGYVHLTEGSPCLPGQHYGVECGLVGALGVECDFTGTESLSWGRIKAGFRSLE